MNVGVNSYLCLTTNLDDDVICSSIKGRERPAGGSQAAKELNSYLHTYLYDDTYIYTYVYIQRERERYI